MVTQVKTWGNGQGIRFSKEMLDSLGIHLNEYLQVNIVNGDIVLSKAFKHRTLEERAEAFGKEPGPYEEFDWGSPLGREEW